MKKGFLLLVFAMSLTFNVSAQYREFQFGLMYQPGYNWLSVSNDNIMNVKGGYSQKYGLSGSFYFTENYGLSTGVVFQSNNASYDFRYNTDGVNYNYNHKFKNVYLQVPVMLKCRTDVLAERLRIMGEFGAGFSFLIDNKNSYSSIGGIYNHLDPKYRTFGASLMIGVGTELILFKNSGLVFQVVFDKNFMNIIKDDEKTKDYYSKMKFTNLYFEIAFFF